MKLQDYLDQQIKFLDQQLHEAKKAGKTKAGFLLESKIEELQNLSKVVEKKIVDKI